MADTEKTPADRIAQFESQDRMRMDELVYKLTQALPDLVPSQKAAKEIIETTLGLITQCLYKGRNVYLPRFGTFVVKERPARRVRNPQGNTFKDVKPSTAFRFRPGSSLKPISHD